ncbi:MAG: 6-carboxytetrahydropterin synthase [Deltaproteobacteria bacterium]|nr:6-carboxytetrahydropterin synthase [Deltaproteobacteria bacterium]
MRPPHRIFVSKDNFKFSAAHLTVLGDGTKERIHGHNFQVSCTLDLKDISCAAFLDFGLIKQAIEAQCREWNELLILAENCPHFQVLRSDQVELEFLLCGKRYVIPRDEVLLLPIDNVVVEALAVELARALVARLGPTLRREVVAGLEVQVTESPGQGAAYYLGL